MGKRLAIFNLLQDKIIYDTTILDFQFTDGEKFNFAVLPCKQQYVEVPIVLLVQVKSGWPMGNSHLTS